MSDIFFSYAIEDREKAAKLAAFFRQQPWTVWVDALPTVGGTDIARETRLEEAKVVVVLWSQNARRVLLVRRTLERAGPGRLVPVLLENVELPAGLSFQVGFDFSGWDAEPDNPMWKRSIDELLKRVHTIVSALPPTAEVHTSPAGAPRFDLLGNELRPQKHSNTPPKEEAQFRGVFISYRRDEAAAYARGLYDRLAAHFGREKVFFDHVNVGWGEDFVEAITSAAESCAVMIVLVSRGWARGAGEKAEADDYVRLEVAKALGRKVRVIPITIQGAMLPAPKELPADLAPLVRRNALALSDARWERDVEDLIKTLESLIKD